MCVSKKMIWNLKQKCFASHCDEWVQVLALFESNSSLEKINTLVCILSLEKTFNELFNLEALFKDPYFLFNNRIVLVECS